MPNSAVIASVAVVGGEPLQGELEVELPVRAVLSEVGSQLQRRLPPGASLELVPRSLDVREGRLLCRLRVRARRAIATEELAEELLEAARSAA